MSSGANKIMRTFKLTIAALLTTPIVLATMASARADDQIERGKYLANIMDCGGCHNTGAFTPEPNLKTPFSGSMIGFEIPGLGIFYPPNLTPDENTGLGKWSDDEIIAAFTKGERPDGRILAPAMPWMAYGHITPDDAKALTAYLRTLPAVEHQVPAPVGPSERAPAPYMTVKMPE
jgi:mono/diheme cytochrome c family protein